MWPPLLEVLEELAAMIIIWGILILGTVVLVMAAFGLMEVFS